MPSPTVLLHSPRRRLLAAVIVYTVLAVVATWPLVARMSDTIASDPGDPILNTSILVWNATTTPLTPAWYDAPHYYPTSGVTALTENLLGVYPVSSPIYWLTHNPLLTYNLTFFLTWPLAAISVFLLVRHLTGRDDAAFVAGLAFAFTPYRAPAFPHLQTLTTFGVALLALGLHGYLTDRSKWWLVVAALAWVHQGFANGYYILYGGLFVAAWVAYFCSPIDRWRAVVPIGIALAAGSVVLAPMLWTYRQVHADLGMHRDINEILYFSASPQSWFEAGDILWLWSKILPTGKDNMFLGATVVLLVAAGIAKLTLTRTSAPPDGRRRWRLLMMTIGIIAAAAVVAACIYGPIDTTLAGIPLKIRGLDRALIALAFSLAGLVWWTPRLRDALARRSVLLFYTAGVFVFGLLACGPDLRVNGTTILNPTPYAWLMALPGFNELRVPTQIKMIHLLCLCVAAGLSYATLVKRRVRWAPLAFTLVCTGVLMDGWLKETPLADAQAMWQIAEPPDRPLPLLELPLGPAWDAGATLRASVHHRRVMNGVSGYDPPYYYALREGLANHDASLLNAIATLGPYDIVVNGEADADHGLQQYAASTGATLIADDGVRRTYAVASTTAAAPLGSIVPIVSMTASDNPQDVSLAFDGKADTGWGVFPQAANQWVVADLGRVVDIGGITHAIGAFHMDFPRQLSIDVSTDGAQWERVWFGPTYAETFIAFVRNPRGATLQFSFSRRQARYVRLRQLGSFERIWRLSELTVHAPR
ncbi:MAG: discoidin domain-containing protein [Vicinamibacterales bacterium]